MSLKYYTELGYILISYIEIFVNAVEVLPPEKLSMRDEEQKYSSIKFW